MEMYARFAHKVLWHDFEPGWALHKSHHEPRTGPFEVSRRTRPALSLPGCEMRMFAYPVLLNGPACFASPRPVASPPPPLPSLPLAHPSTTGLLNALPRS